MKTLKNQISSKFTSLVCILLASLTVFASTSAFAQNATDTWVGNTSANLNDSNWTGNNPPIPGDNWVFGTAGTFGTILNDNYGSGISVSNIMFGPGASAFTFTGNPITVTRSITNSSTALQTFNGNITLTGASNTVALNAGGGDITIGGILTNTSSLLSLVGGGNLTLTNINTAFTSQMIIGTGSTFTISGAGAIGSLANGIYTWNNAALSTTNNGTIVYSSSVTNDFEPRLDGTGGIIVNGPGMFRPSAANSAGWTGPLVVNGGIYSDNKGTPANGRSGFGDTGGGSGLSVNRPVTANNGGILSIDVGTAFDQNNNQYIYSLVFIINTNSLLRVTTGTSIICNTILNGGALMATNGSFVLGGTITTGGGFKSSMLSSNGGYNFGSTIVSAGYQTPFVVNPTPAGSGAGGDDLYVEATLRNGGAATGFTLSGGGTMRVVKPSIFTGPVSITQGKLILGNPLIPGDQTVWGTNGDYLGNITVSSNATFVVNTTQPQIFEGILSGTGGGGSLIVSPGVTLSLGVAASTVSPLTLVISNTATLDVSQMTSGSLGSTVMGFGTINGNATTASGAVIKGGIPGTFGTLAINGNLTMAVGAIFNLELGATAAGPNGQVTVSGSLAASGTQIHLSAPSTVANLDTQNYTLVTSAGFSGSVSPAPIWDVAPANANHYFITNINNNIVLAYSSIALPTPGGTSSPANVLRNQNALLVVTAVPGPGQTVTNLVVDASSLGGSSSLALAPNGVLNTWTNSVPIAAGQAPGVYFLPATAIDTTPSTGNGIVVVNVIASTEVWAGLGGNQNFDTAVNWAVQPGQTAAYPPASSGDWLSFAGSANLTPVLNQSYSVNGLTFTNGAGTFNLTASGGNVLTVAGGGGVTNLSANTETINLPILSSSAGPATFSASNGNLTMSGGFADNNGGLAVSGSMAKTFTLAGANTFTGPLFLNRGTMALATSLTETYHIWVPQIANSTAVLNVLSGGNLAVVAGTNMTIAPQPGAIGAMSVSAGGSISIPSGTLTLGSGSGSTAYFNMTGGNVGVGSFIYVASLGDKARFDMSGGTCTVSNDLMRIGTGTGQPVANGEVNFSGGTYNSLNSWTTAGLGGGIFVGESGTGVLNILGNAMVNVWGETNMVIGVNTTGTSPGYTAQGRGTVNLLGGTLVTAQIAGGTGLLSVFNFNGGTVSNYTGGISFSIGGLAPYFMYNLQNTYVYSGGAIIDDGGGSIIINQSLQAPSGFGLPGITVTSGGSGYLTPPLVTVSGGSGTGATASAAISAAGQVTTVNVTCPGTGYATGEKLTIAFAGGGGTGAAATNLTLVANRSGGLTYSSLGGAGGGMLTLLGPATYTNTTVIKSGTLQLGVGGSINNSAVIAISNNATFDGSPAGGITLNTQLLKGFGNVNSVLTAKAGSMIYPGNDPAIGTLTFNSGGLNMAAGSAATFNLNTSATVGPNDQVVINGASSSLIFANNTMHIKAPNSSTALDTVTPYILFQNNSSVNTVGLPNVTPAFDVPPSNVGVGFWLIQPSGNNIVLLNSSVAPPGGLASVTAGAINGTNVVRNTTITVSVGVSGPNPVTSVTVDLSGYGGAVTPLTQVGATTNWTGSMTIPPGLPPGPFNMPIVAYDGNLYGGVPLPLNALPTAVTWNGANFNSTPNTDNNGNWAGSAAPGYVGDTTIFAGSTGLQPVFNQNYILNNIGFASGAGRFVLNSSVGSIGITGGVTNNSANVETLNIPLTLAGTVFSGASGNLVLSNTLSGSGLLNIGAGAGGVTLSGTDAHTGNTTIASGGSLIMGPFGQWQDPFSNPYYTGATTNNGTFTYNSPLDQSIVGVISGAGSITVNGPGTLTLNASNSYSGSLTINGTRVIDPVPVNGGTPTVSGLGNPQSGNTNIINNGGILSLEANGGNEFGNGSTTPTSKFIINQGGIVRITSGNATMGPITLNGGTLSIAAAASAQYSPYELSSITVGGTSPSTISCESAFVGNPNSGINLTINGAANAQMPINVASTGSGGPDLLVSAVMVNAGGSQNAAGFNKAGTGTMEMNAVNIYTGPTTVGNGAVILDGAGQLNGGVYSNSMIISNGAAFIFASNAQQTNSGVVSGAGSLVVSNTTGSGLVLTRTNTLTGPVAIKAGTLTLFPGALLNNSSNVLIAGGATFDVSQLASPYVWPAASSLSASGNAASPALINSAGAVNLSSSSAVNLTYDNIDVAPQPALNITGTLSLGGNAFTVNTANGLPLATNASYVLIQTTGAITDGGNYPAVTGTAIGSGSQGAISVSGQQVILTVSAKTISTVPPTLASSRSGPVFTLSWPPDHLGYTLQSNSISLAVPADWFNVPGSSSVTNYTINLQSVQSNVFYRLILPP